MACQPHAGSAANASAAEISGLIPAGGASFRFIGYCVRHQTTDRQHDERGGNL
jgi:hypothetical protein